HRLAARLLPPSAATLARAGARAIPGRPPAGPAPPLAPRLFAHGADEREHRVEEPVEPRPVALVLHQRGREPPAQDLPLDAARGRGARAGAGAAPGASASATAPAPPPPGSAGTTGRRRARTPADASRSGVEERDDARQPGDEREERVDRREHDHRLVRERLLREPAEDHEEPARLRLEE